MPTAPLAHEWQHRLDHRDCSENVDVELTPHLFERTLLKSPFVAVSGTVDEDVDRTNISFGPRNLETDGSEIRDIQYDGSRACGVDRAELLARAASLRTVPITEYPDESASVARARPKPEPAPVIRKFLFSLIAMSFLHHRSCARRSRKPLPYR